MAVWECVSRGVWPLLGVAGAVLVLSLSLWSYSAVAVEIGDLPDALLSLFLSRWMSVVGLAGSALIPLWLLVRAKTTCKEHLKHA